MFANSVVLSGQKMTQSACPDSCRLEAPVDPFGMTHPGENLYPHRHERDLRLGRGG